jgi:hypothetical protein
LAAGAVLEASLLASFIFLSFVTLRLPCLYHFGPRFDQLRRLPAADAHSSVLSGIAKGRTLPSAICKASEAPRAPPIQGRGNTHGHGARSARTCPPCGDRPRRPGLT